MASLGTGGPGRPEIDLPAWDLIFLSEMEKRDSVTALELANIGVPSEVPDSWIAHALAQKYIETASDQRYLRLTPTGFLRLEEARGEPDHEISVGLDHGAGPARPG